ncbi:MAG: hypothetical protein H0X03_06105, partial [Nitrosopumilus sp.]|nr:hypothetical protein [Nitrosopumilus sp.]
TTLNAEENRAIHSFVRSWKPNLVIDVHNYPPKRKYLEEKNYIFYHDILIDSSSNLAVSKKMGQEKLNRLIKDIQFDLSPFNYSCERYVLINSEGKVRHSTHEIIDARNFLSLRNNTCTILLEAKDPISKEENEIERTISAQYIALLSILKWANQNMGYLVENSSVLPYKKGDNVPIRCKYISSDIPFRRNFINTLTKKTEEVVFPCYESSIRATRYVKLPFAYAIPIDKNRILKVLHNHGFKAEHLEDSKAYTVEKYVILSLNPPKVENKPASKVEIMGTYKEQKLENYEIFSVNQVGGHALALLLEPQSEYGLYKYEELNLNLASGSDYPILRVM